MSFCECPSTCKGDNFCVFFRSRSYRIGRSPTGECPETFFIAFFCGGSGRIGIFRIHCVFGFAFGVIGVAICRKGNIFGNTVAAAPFVNNLIGCCNRLRLECPSTFEGNGSNYFISAIIGCTFIFCPTAEGVCTVVSVNSCKRVFGVTIKSSILVFIFCGICRKFYVSRNTATPFVVDCVNALFLFPFCGQGDIFAGSLDCCFVLEKFVLIFPTQEFIILRGGLHPPDSVVT